MSLPMIVRNDLRTFAFVLVSSALLCGCKSGAADSAVNAQPVASDGASSAVGTSSVSYSGTQTVSVNDPAYRISAATLSIPQGWKWLGTIVRTGGCHTTGPAIDFTALGQDGITGMFSLPGVNWYHTLQGPPMPTNTPFGKCSDVNLHTSTEVLLNVAIPMLHPSDVTLEAIQPLPNQASLNQQLQQMRQQDAGMAPPGHPELAPQNRTLEGSRVRIAYTLRGVAVEEMVQAVVTCSDHRTAPSPVNRGQGGVTRYCTERGTTIWRAPKGQLDALLSAPAVANMLSTFKANPEWQQKVSQEEMAEFQQFEKQLNSNFQKFMAANQAQFNQEIANDRAQDAARSAQTQRAMAQDRATQAGIDNAAHQTVNMSLGRQDFTDPSTGRTVTLSDQYRYQWISQSGQVVQGNDPNTDPNRELPFEGPFTELVPQ